MQPQSPKPFKHSVQQHNGFSLVEVLVSILMIAGFLATAMQALIAATAIKVRSEEISEATTWMQEDLEAIKFEANRLGFIDTDSDGDADTYKPDLDNDGDIDECASGFAEFLRDELRDTSGSPPNYKYADDQGQRKSSSIGQRPYIIVRKLAVDTSQNPNILEVQHQIFTDQDKNLSKAGEGKPISELYSEIIPDVAFSCP